MTFRILSSLVMLPLIGQAQLKETLPPLKDGKAPQNFTGLWADFDPRAEPLDTEILHEWEQDGVILRVVRFRVGVFKGEKAMLAGVYGFPKGAKKIPGLVNIHGGGQYADSNAVLTNAKRGYATVTISWAGRISSPEYRVTPAEVQLFWEGKIEDPKYKITTDWGALDGYHAPSRHGKDAFVTIRDGSEDWTLDSVESPRNSSWFLATMGARRALTFLERQPEVDGERLGVYGHSMGGKLTVQTAGSDSRVKAAAPSCGGISDRYNENPLHRNAVGDSPALTNIQCPTIFLKPANDFHSHINNLVDATRELGDNDWRVTCSPHINHQDLPEYEVATQLWFDQYLKGKFTWPKTPETTLALKNDNGVPVFSVKPDPSRDIESVEIFYTQQGHDDGDRAHRLNRINRFWHHASTKKQGDQWVGVLPVFSTDLPLWVYANVVYPLENEVSGAGYYFGDYTTKKFNVSSLIKIVSPEELQAAGVKPILKATPLIENFEGDWKKEWFSLKPEKGEIKTHKIYHPIWKAPAGAKLAFEIQAAQANKFVIGIDGFAAELKLNGGETSQTFVLSPADFLDAENQPMENWDDIKELRLVPAEHLRSKDRKKKPRLVGGSWKGDAPQFEILRWVVSE